MRNMTERRRSVSLILVAAAIGLALFAIAKRAECQGGKWCSPQPCFSGLQCGECFCLREAYPEPGICVDIG